MFVPRSARSVSIDGALSDEAWRSAARIDVFYEFSPGDNIPPPVRTTAYVTYDADAIYFGLRCEDPDTRRLRAPFADRDSVIGNQDYISLFLDTQNDGKAALFFTANARGIQSDGIWTDATSGQDFSPDYFWEAATRIEDSAWTAAFRIPLSILRYAPGTVQTWRVAIFRSYPRGFRHQILSHRQPRGSNCSLCHAVRLTGIAAPPTVAPLVAAPYAAGHSDAGGARRTVNGRIGGDLKWRPVTNLAVDATVNPDFSQIEADAPQLAVNNRFALFFPEKRPFFLERTDLFQTPIQAVYTRTVTSPAWGLRATGEGRSSIYSLLIADDRGGGSAVLPGPTSSELVPQDFGSQVVIGRYRQTLGASFAGLLLTGRRVNGGGHNWVAGPDEQWQPNDRHLITAQFLVSDTRTPDRPDLSASWDGRSFASRAAYASWAYTTAAVDAAATYRDVGSGFRADEGFVPQVGIRDSQASAGYRLYLSGLLNALRTSIRAEYAADPSGRTVTRQISPGVDFQGRWNLNAELRYYPAEEVRIGEALLRRSYGTASLQLDPSQRIMHVELFVRLGQDVDVANARPGHGGEISALVRTRPTDHVSLDVSADRQWVEVAAPTAEQRLFTALTARARATYFFSGDVFLRLIADRVEITRDPSLYKAAVSARTESWGGSSLFGWRLNWQTALYVGAAVRRDLPEAGAPSLETRQYFVKASYAFRR